MVIRDLHHLFWEIVKPIVKIDHFNALLSKKPMWMHNSDIGETEHSHIDMYTFTYLSLWY